MQIRACYDFRIWMHQLFKRKRAFIDSALNIGATPSTIPEPDKSNIIPDAATIYQ